MILIFVLVLLLNVLFDGLGDPVVLGNISIVGLVLYFFYCLILITPFNKEYVLDNSSKLEKDESIKDNSDSKDNLNEENIE